MTPETERQLLEDIAEIRHALANALHFIMLELDAEDDRDELDAFAPEGPAN